MAELRPFRGVRFDPARAGADLGSLIAPPFDVIEVREHAALLERDPHNVVRLELPLDRPGGVPATASGSRPTRPGRRHSRSRCAISPSSSPTATIATRRRLPTATSVAPPRGTTPTRPGTSC